MKRTALFPACLLALALLVHNTPAAAQLAANKAPGAEKTTDINPTSSSKEAVGFFNEGLIASDMGETNKARTLFTKAIEKDPDFGLAYLLRAGTATNTNAYVDDINKGRIKVANASEWEKMYADYLYTNFTGERDKGVEIAWKIAQANPAAARAQSDLAIAYYGNNQYDKAEAAFLRAVELNPSWAGGYSGLANIYMFSDRRDLAKAQQNALKGTNLMPNSAGAHILLGDTYRAQNNFQKAAEEYKKAIQLDDKAAEGYYKLGHANLFLGNINEARKNYNDAGERDSRKSFAEMLAACTYAYEGDSKKTMKQLMTAAARPVAAGEDKNEIDGARLTFLNAAASIAAHNGDAATLRQLITRIAPLSHEMSTSLGTSEAMLYDQAEMLRWEVLLDATEGRSRQAMEKAEKMKTILEPVKDSRKLEGYHSAVAIIDLKEKNYKNAIEELGMADPNSIYTKYLLAKAYDGMGDNAKAMNYYTEVSNFNFSNIENAIVRYEVKKKLK
jgi:tetratricopeptide (TPR) repeat protein